MQQQLKNIDHIGIAVSDLQEVIDTFKNGFDMDPSFTEEIADQNIRMAGYTMGDSVVEYFEPISPDSPISRFLEKRKNGIHHIAFRVENLSKTLAELKGKGFQLIDEEPKKGTNGSKIAFIHPASFNGILIELCELR